MKHNRREMVKKGLGILSIASVAGIMPIGSLYARRKKKGDKAGGGGDLVSLDNPMAKNVNYQHDKSKITDDSLKVKKQGVEWKDQYCENCQLYQDTGDGKGKCTLFPGKLVKAKGWCSTWAKKA